jgi:hypothetical protein
MAIIGRQVDGTSPSYPGAVSGGLPPQVINTMYQFVASAGASASNNVYTRSDVLSAATVNSTVAPGTQPDYARNLVVKLTPNTGSSAYWSGGTIVALGSDFLGRSLSESWAITALRTLTAGSAGSYAFASVGTISFKSVSAATASSSDSGAFSMHVGAGQVLGFPASVRSSNAVQWAYIGTAKQSTVSATASTSNNQWTVQTGDVGRAGISMSSAYASNTPFMAFVHATR